MSKNGYLQEIFASYNAWPPHLYKAYLTRWSWLLYCTLEFVNVRSWITWAVVLHDGGRLDSGSEIEMKMSVWYYVPVTQFPASCVSFAQPCTSSFRKDHHHLASLNILLIEYWRHPINLVAAGLPFSALGYSYKGVRWCVLLWDSVIRTSSTDSNIFFVRLHDASRSNSSALPLRSLIRVHNEVQNDNI